MRRFTDARGLPWDVVLGRESWGSLYALFVPAGTGRTETVRQALLRAESYEAAQTELERMPEPALLELFDSSTPKES